MKRLFLLATAAIVALASCTKTQVVNTEAPEEIAFKTVAGAMTKADFSGTLGVFAEYNDGTSTTTYFENAPFAEDGGVWKGSKYWPKEGTLDFTFYAPHMNSGAEYDDATKTLTLTIPDNGSAQTDYLVGKTRPMGESYTPGNNVNVELDHVLASIKFTVKADKPSVYEITSMVLNDTKQAGTAIFEYTDAGTSYDVSVEDPTGDTDFDVISTNTPVGASDESVGVANGYLVFPSTGTTVTVEYTIEDAPQTVTLDLSADEWLSGTQYTYAISFTSNEILVSPIVVNTWAAGTTTAPVTIQ